MEIVSRRVVAALSLATCLLAQPSHAQQEDAADAAELQKIADSGKLRVGVNPNFRPFSFLDDAEARVGVDIDIAGRLAEALGVELEVTAPDEFTDLIPMLVDDEIDLILAGMSITFERAKEVNFTDPYFDTGISILMNIGSSARLGIAGAKDSEALVETLSARDAESRLRIAVTEGKAPALEAERRFPDAQITGYPTNEEAVAATARGDADVMIHDEIFLKLWVEQNEPAARHRMVVLDPPIKADFYGIAVRKGDPDWLRLLDVFVRDLRLEGEVIGYLSEYLPSMTVTESSDGVIPRVELRDME